MCQAYIMKLNQKKRSALIFIFILCLFFHTDTGISAKQDPIVYSQSGVTGISRNACELRTRWEAISLPTSRFLVNPSVCSPYSPGLLSESIIAQGVSYVNFIRYAAGLPLVVADTQDNLSAQYGAMLLAASDTLSHTPARPADMPLALYQTCLQALSQSNISCMRFMNASTAAQEKQNRTMPLAIQNYMDAQGSSNRANVAHRRWILNPDLCTVGIGCADANAATVYQVLKIFDMDDSTQSTPDYQFIAWPSSGAFPAQALSHKTPWSITLNPEIFKIPKRDDLTITITRDDGKCWTLNQKSAADSSKEEFLLVDTKAYGVANCIIFAFASGSCGELSGSYHVTVSGLTTISGKAAMLDYTTTFADMEKTGHIWSSSYIDTPATCTEAGLFYRTCVECGFTEKKISESLGHCWAQTELLRASEKYVAGKAKFVCTRCGEQKIEALPLTPCDPATCSCSQFTDAPPDTNWAHNSIDFVVENGLFTGITPTVFAPKNPMTRAMMITVLWRMAGMPKCTDAVSFSDIAAGQYYTEAVAWGVSNGIVSGVSANCFAPETTVTREQAITFLYRFFGSDKRAVSGSVLSDFADSGSIHNYAQNAMLWAVQNEILSGNSQQCLCPRNDVTREQAATIVMRCMQN